jgi:hypothetical protein
MSGIKPLFTSAPRIKIYINGTAVAYAIGMNVNINVDLRPVQVMGKFGTLSIEPTMYNVVSGTMQIIKVNERKKMVPASTIPGQVTKSYTLDAAGKIVDVKDASTELGGNSLLSTNNLAKHLDPRTVLGSETFDLYLYLKTDDTTEVPWMKISDVRLSGRNTNISMGQLVNEPVNFQGLWASPVDEDGAVLFAADFGANG